MPGCAQNQIVREGEIAVYHTWSRCVQRAYLCGDDPLTKRCSNTHAARLHRPGSGADIQGLRVSVLYRK